ncbi:MAG: hypothetical protein H6710_15975 [Myxococcales bacterium]|nr:hypothetical protein [Myxococcales bacterium]
MIGRALALASALVVQAVIVLTKDGASERSTIAGPAGEIRVLELAAPADGPISEAAWAEALGFLAAVERDLLGDR